MPDVYEITRRGASFANDRHPEVYAEYLRGVDSVFAEPRVPGAPTLAQVLRALTYTKQFGKALELSQRAVDLVRAVESSTLTNPPYVQVEDTLQVLQMERGAIFVALGQEDRALQAYTSAAQATANPDLAVRELNRRLLDKSGNGARESVVHPGKRAEMELEVRKKLRTSVPRDEDLGLAYQYLGDEYAHRLAFSLAERAYRRAGPLLRPADDARAAKEYRLEQEKAAREGRSPRSREKVIERAKGSFHWHNLDARIANLRLCTPE